MFFTVIGYDNKNQVAKFWYDHLSDWYFTDQNVKMANLRLRVIEKCSDYLNWPSKLTSVPINSVTWSF